MAELAAQDVTPNFVESADGVRIATYEQGNPQGPTLVLTHGWPDSHVLWDGVVPLLADRFRIIRYDNRGVGLSSAPTAVKAYTTGCLADDLGAVIDNLSPGQPVHVLGHDWGSIATWEYLSRPGADDRIASFTSVSGPSTDHLKHAIWSGLARPYRPRRFLTAAEQLLRLSYVYPLSVPVVAPAAIRGWFGRRGGTALTDGVPPAQRHRADSLATDAANTLKIYRAATSSGPRAFRTDHYVGVPVQVIVNTRDPFLRPSVFDGLSRWVPRLWRRDITAGHWSPMSHPGVLARSVAEFVDHLEGAPACRGLLRAQVGRPREPFGDTLVSVTGAGSGIGRETAFEFARQGAELIVSDIDEASAKDTAARIAARGGVAHPYVLDVSDADAVERFADEVCAAHGVPDIVVNNAGIGHAGRFLDTPRDQWDRVLDVNLGGVVNGCRSFAGRLVERGTGGHIVNVASMMSYFPQQSLNAYCTSKAAVYMFSDCLRAELDAAGVGLTTICPGAIDTNIVATTRMDAPAGSGGEVEGRRELFEKLFAVRKYSPEKVAKAIVSAVRKDKPIRPVAPEAYLVYGVAHALPQGMRNVARTKLL